MKSVHGSKIIYMYRPLNEEAKKSAALRLAFVKENGKTVSTDADTTQTKDGILRSPSQAEIEITSTSVLASDDKMIEALEKAQLNNEKVEVWEINLAKQDLLAVNIKEHITKLMLLKLKRAHLQMIGQKCH